ncbi:MAG: hypothetical protein ABH832_03450 [bacterium]
MSKTAPPPDNLPVDPNDDEARGPSRQGNTNSPTIVWWGDFKLDDQDIADFRKALLTDYPEKNDWTDDEIRQMAYNSIHLFALIMQIEASENGAESASLSDN